MIAPQEYTYMPNFEYDFRESTDYLYSTTDPGPPPGSAIPAYQATTLLHRLKLKIISHLNTYAHTLKITLQNH